MLYTCDEAKFNDAKNEQELIDYAKQVVENKFFNHQVDGSNVTEEIEKITDVNTANEALMQFAGEKWYPVTEDDEIKVLIQNRLELDAYDVIEHMLEDNGLYGQLDEKIITEAEMLKLAESNADDVLERYASENGGNSSVNQFVDQFMESNGVNLAEQIFSFSQYWDVLTSNAIDNLVANGIDINDAKTFCIPANGKDVQVAAYSEADAEEVAEHIKESEK